MSNPADQENTPARRGGAGIFVAMAVGLLLILMLAVPGFVAGWYHRATGKSPAENRAIMVFLYPSLKLGGLSPRLNEVYAWEYAKVAG